MSKLTQINRRNNDLGRKLSRTNQAMITDMTVYLRMAPISDYQIEEIRQDILDMALSAQERGEPLSNVFGEDGKTFCDEIIANVAHRKPGSLILQWLQAACAVISIFGVIDIVFSGYLIGLFQSIRSHAKINLSYQISLGFLVNGVVIAVASFAIVWLIGKHSFEAKNLTKKFDSLPKPKKFLIGCVCGAVLCGYLFGVVRLTGIILVSVNIIIYCVLLLALFVVYKIGSRI